MSTQIVHYRTGSLEVGGFLRNKVTHAHCRIKVKSNNESNNDQVVLKLGRLRPSFFRVNYFA